MRPPSPHLTESSSSAKGGREQYRSRCSTGRGERRSSRVVSAGATGLRTTPSPLPKLDVEGSRPFARFSSIAGNTCAARGFLASPSRAVFRLMDCAALRPLQIPPFPEGGAATGTAGSATVNAGCKVPRWAVKSAGERWNEASQSAAGNRGKTTPEVVISEDFNRF